MRSLPMGTHAPLLKINEQGRKIRSGRTISSSSTPIDPYEVQVDVTPETIDSMAQLWFGYSPKSDAAEGPLITEYVRWVTAATPYYFIPIAAEALAKAVVESMDHRAGRLKRMIVWTVYQILQKDLPGVLAIRLIAQTRGGHYTQKWSVFAMGAFIKNGKFTPRAARTAMIEAARQIGPEIITFIRNRR